MALLIWGEHWKVLQGTTKTDGATWRLAPQVFSLISIRQEGVLLYWLSTRVWCGSRHKAAGQLECNCVFNSRFLFNEQLKKTVKENRNWPRPVSFCFFISETKPNWQFQADGLCCVCCHYDYRLFNAVTRLVLSAPCKVPSKGIAFYMQYIRSFNNKQESE